MGCVAHKLITRRRRSQGVCSSVGTADTDSKAAVGTAGQVLEKSNRWHQVGVRTVILPPEVGRAAKKNFGPLEALYRFFKGDFEVSGFRPPEIGTLVSCGSRKSARRRVLAQFGDGSGPAMD